MNRFHVAFEVDLIADEALDQHISTVSWLCVFIVYNNNINKNLAAATPRWIRLLFTSIEST